MALNRPRRLLMKAAIAAETDVEFVALRVSGQTGAMAEWYNAVKTPAALAWKSAVSAFELDEAADYAAFDTILPGKRDAWAIFLQYAPRDLSKNKLRKVVTDIWGNAILASVSEAILTAGTRQITRAEAVLGGTNIVGTGVVNAIRLTWAEQLSNQDIVDSLSEV